MSRVLAVAPVLPDHPYAQEDIARALGPLMTTSPVREALLHRLHRGSGVRRRHLALPLDRYASLGSFEAANSVFLQVGAELAERALRTALDQAGLEPGDVDHVFATSVTGVAAPSLDALIAHRLGLRAPTSAGRRRSAWAARAARRVWPGCTTTCRAGRATWRSWCRWSCAR